MKMILLSGGIDSTTLIYEVKRQRQNTVAVFFNYGQKSYEKELDAVREITKDLGVKLIIKDITALFNHSQSSIVKRSNREITVIKTTDNHTTYESKDTAVEFRNGVMLASAISIAQQLYKDKKVTIMLGVIKTREPFYDCTFEFIKHFNALAKGVSNNKITVSAPFVVMGKDEVVTLAKKLKVPLNKTWSCYDNKETSCGICPQCIDRKILEVDK